MILCCGEALIDLVPDTNAKGEIVLRPMAGGSVFNTAIALSRLQQQTGFLSGISTDQFGQQLIKQLDETGVDQTLCIRSGRPTTLAVVELKDGEACYRFYDEGSAGRMIEVEDLPPIPPTTGLLLFGGISLIAQPCADTFEHLLKITSKQYFTFLDPNIRSEFIEDATSHRQRIKRMIAYADIVKVSTDDLAWIAPEGEPETVARQWLEGRTKIVLLSQGGDGARLFSNKHNLFAPAEETNVVDTIGAGDAFNAGFLASIYSQSLAGKMELFELGRNSMKHALCFANHVGALSTKKKGANPPWARDLSLAPSTQH